MNFDPSNDEPRWASDARQTWLTSQREDLVEQFGPDAVMSVMRMVALFADLIAIGSDNIPLIKAGVTRMAEVVNSILPTLNGDRHISRGHDHRDLDGVLDPIPDRVQDVFIECVGEVLLNSKGGPFDSAVNINERVDALVTLMKGER